MIFYSKHKSGNINILILLMLLFLFNGNLFSQETSVLDSVVSYKVKNKKLDLVLSEIGGLIGYEFSYNPDLLATNNIIKARYENIQIRNLLINIINDSTLTFKLVDKQVVITKRNHLSKLMFANINGEIISYIKLEGKILDKDSKQSLSFANISIKEKSIGTISNEQGDFNLSISKGFISDTLVFSYIGYKNTYIPIQQLSLNHNLIYLTPDNYKIKEVVVRAYDAKEILLEAKEKIKDNYHTDPYQITAFYREMVMKNTNLVAITEAVMSVYKSPYLGTFSDQVKLLKGRKNEYYSPSDTIALKLRGGLHASLFLDLIKNPTYFFREEFFHLYDYSIDKIMTYNDKSVYVIDFKPVRYIDQDSFQGKIFIDIDCLSVVAVEFNLTQDALYKIGKDFVVKKAFRTVVKPTSVKYTVNYRKINDKYFFNFAKGELAFKVKFRKKLFSNNFNTVFEFASNNIDTVNVERFKRKQVLSSNKVFIDENYDYDHQFWGEYNYISPEKSLQDALIEIQKKVDSVKE